MTQYTPISQIEEIQNPDISKILDYLERHSKTFEKSAETKTDDGMMMKYSFLGMRLWIDEKDSQITHKEKQIEITIPTKVLSENIVGIFASIRDL